MAQRVEGFLKIKINFKNYFMILQIFASSIRAKENERFLHLLIIII